MSNVVADADFRIFLQIFSHRPPFLRPFLSVGRAVAVVGLGGGVAALAVGCPSFNLPRSVPKRAP